MDQDIKIHQDTSVDHIAGKLWEAAPFLIQYLQCDLVNRLEQSCYRTFSVLELGSGTGYVGIHMARMLSKIVQSGVQNAFNVVLTDIEAALPLIQSNISRNLHLMDEKVMLSKKEQYQHLHFGQYGVWEALEILDQLVDSSDPDTENSQLVHALQSAEAARKSGESRLMQLTCLIHDLGKLLALKGGEPQWAVVGDTFPVGCRFDERVVYHQYFAEQGNPDLHHPVYSTLHGIYKPHCGLSQVHMSWGHDEYLYQVCRPYLPEEALYAIRYHSFYSAHREGAYSYLLDERDHQMMPFLKSFNKYDLYSKADNPISVQELMPYYTQLISEYFPEKIQF
ncbi:hypothetical protein MIR68_011271 [Amoeboaphelidium protococcarum]|nr:hypothetical protein MIR68_011271 [Amoeboaphelidium protococcarum]